MLVTPSSVDVISSRAARRGRPQRPVDDPADRRLRQPERRRDRDRVPDRPRPPADRLPRRPSRPRVGAAAASRATGRRSRRAGIAVRRRSRPCRRVTAPRRARTAARELLDRDDRPTAIFAANDTSAIETIAAARELGLVGARGSVRGRVRQRPGVCALRAAADDGRPVRSSAWASRPCGCCSALIDDPARDVQQVTFRRGSSSAARAAG